MAFRFGDPGGRLYNAVGTSQVNLLAWWPGTNVTPSSFTIVGSGSRTSGNSLRAGLGAVSYISKNLDPQPIWGIAFAIKTELIPASGTPIFTLLDSGTVQCDLRLNSDSSWSVTRNGTVLGTTTTTIPFGIWVHIECKIKIDNSVGTAEVRINGAAAGLNLTAQDTQNTANNTANTIAFGRFAGGGNVQAQFDDIIIYDGQTTDSQGNPDINDWIGDCGLAWSLPNGDGATTQFSRDSGANNYLRVADATPDGDSSYTFDNTVNHIDTYAMANLPAGATGVKSLMAVSYMRKDDVGTRMVAPVIYTNTANFVGPTISLPGSYFYYANTWGQNPSGTPALWTVSDINNIEGGLKVIS